MAGMMRSTVLSSAVTVPRASTSLRPKSSGPVPAYTARVRKRWFSGRALLLHLAVAVIVPGCLVAAWWQATRALAGNGLSWFYSVEWPVFALLAIYGWWHLIHEDPEVYEARKHPQPEWDESDNSIDR
jgi:hypothetical protein